MHPGLKSITAFTMALAFGAIGQGFALNTNPAGVEPGDTVRISIPFKTMSGGISPMRNVRLAVANAPAWVELDTTTSYMGPVDIYPGERIAFYGDFAIASSYNPLSPAGTIILNLLSDSTSFVPSGITWTFTTDNGFKTSNGACMASDGIPCGNYAAPDMLPPNTYPVFEGPYYEPDPNMIFISSLTSISFVGSDAYESNTLISRSAVTGYAIGTQPASLDSLNFSTVPVILGEGVRTLYYASRDYAGNAEVIKSTIVIVDGTAPGAPVGLRADGAILASPWKNVREFNLSWNNPSDVSGIGGVRVKFGDPAPVSNEEGVLYPPGETLVYSSTQITPGDNNVVRLWLEDNVGNAEPANAAHVTLRFDDRLPVSTASAPAFSSSAPMRVGFGASDAVSGVARTALWWRHESAAAWSSGTYTLAGGSGTFGFDPGGATGTIKFYTQAFDLAGNAEPAPVSTTTPKASAYVDISPPVFSNVRVTEINDDSARISWETSDETVGLVEYGLSSALGSSVSASGYLASRSVLLSGLVYPANYYFKISALNKTELWSDYSGSFYVPPKMTTNIDSWGAINTNQPIVIEVTNPAVSTITYTLNGQTTTQAVSPNVPLEIYVPSGQGQSSLSLNMDGFVYATDFIVDTATRTVFLTRFVNSAGGLMSSTQTGQSAVDTTTGQTAQEELSNGQSRLYLGYYAGIDSVAPGSITYLSAGSVAGSDRAVLTWIAPGDDADVGTAVKYDLRWSTSQINSTNFPAAARGTDIPFPLSAGTSQEAIVSGLNQLATYYFSIRTEDELGNISGLSNLAAVFKGHVLASTVTVNGNPEISFMASVAPSITLISTVSVVGSVAIGSATAGGLTSAGNLYEIGPEGIFDPPALLTFYYSTATLSSLGLLEADLVVYEHFPEAGWVKLPGQVLDTVAHKVIVPITRIASLFGVFGIVRDRVPPVTELVYGGVHIETGGKMFINYGSSVILNAFDPVVYGTATGVSFTEYRVDPGTAPAFMTYVSPFTLTQGVHLIEFHSRDKAGNTEAEKHGEVYVDTAAPVTAALISGTTGQNDWYISAATVTLVSTDSLSGLAGVYYHTNASTAPVNYAVPIVISSEGVSSVYYYAEDAVGNREPEKILRVRVDIGAPSVIAASTPSANISGWNNTAVGVVFTGSDTVSGLAYCSSSTTVSGEGAGQVLNGSCFDNAGLSSTRTVSVSIDTTPPSIQYSSAPWPNEFGWNSSTVTLTFDCADALSDVKTCPAPAVFTLEGVNLSTSVAALDKAGNQQTLSAGGIKIDKTPPASGASLTGTLRNGWYSSAVSLTLTSTDALSGVRQAMYSADGASFAAYQQALSVSADGPHVVKYYALDKAGNTEAIQTASLSIDRTAPQVGYTIMPPPNQDGWNKGPVTVVFSGTDTLSGVEICSQIFVSTEGPRQAAGWCRDRAGNQGYSTAPVKIDLTSPTVSALASPPANGRGWNNTAVTVVFSGYDTLSGDPNCMGGGTVTGEGAGQIVSGSCMNKAGLVSYAGQVVNVDKTAPALSISSPVAGQVFIATRGDIGVKFGVTDNLDPAPASGAWLEQMEDRGSPRGVRPARLAVSDGQAIEPLGIDDGVWRLTVSATDFADNAALLTGGTFEVIHDVLAPRTGQAITAGPSLTVGATTYITSAARLELTSIDDLVLAGDGIGLGVKGQAVRLWSGGSLVKELSFTNPAPRQGEAFTSSFTGAGLGLADGSYNLAYNAADVLGTVEAGRSVIIGLDNTAPVSTAALAGMPGENGWHVSTVTVSLSAVDALSGVAVISYKLGNNAFLPYTSAFETAAEGQHTVEFYGKDRLGNTETEKSAAFKIDRTPPVVTAAITPSANSDGWHNGTVRAGFSGADAISGIVYCEPAKTLRAEGRVLELKGYCRDQAGLTSTATARFNIDLTSPTIAVVRDPLANIHGWNNTDIKVSYACADALSGIKSCPSAVTLAVEGAGQGTSGTAADFADNITSASISGVNIDKTAPAGSLSISGVLWESGSYKYLNPGSAIALAATDGLSGVGAIEYHVDETPFGVYSSSFSLAEGMRAIHYRAIDKADNIEATRTALYRVDGASPATFLKAVGGSRYPSPEPGSFYASLASRFALEAADPVTNGVASGVRLTSWSDNGGATSNTTESLAFAEGRHVLAYWSVDNVDNQEVTKSTTILVDNTAPVTTHHIGSPYYAAGGVNYITPATPLTFTAGDPVFNNVASGVNKIEIALDGSAFSAYTVALKFNEGRHTIKYRSIDNVGNVEAERVLEVQSDNTAPISQWSVAGGDRIERGGKFYLNALGRIAFESEDPIISAVASGVEGIYYGIDAVPAEKYAATLGLVEGVRTIKFSAKDNVGNMEVVKSTVIYVDGTKPVTELSVSGDQYKSDRQYVSRRTDIVIAAADPVVNEVSVGVRQIKYAVDGAAFGDYSQFKLGAEGRRLVSFYSTDYVNNVEVVKTTELWVDGTAPLSVLDVLGGSQYPGAEPGSFYASLATKFGFVSVDPAVSSGAAGVKAIEYADNSGAPGVYSQPISLGEGKHSITYMAIDRVENIEVFRSTQIYIDNTAPVTSFNIAGPLYLKEGARHVTPESELTFTSADPLVSEVSAGVERIETAVDGGQWLKYTQALKFAEGRHTIKYRAIDNVGNTEAERVLELRSDVTPPVTAQHIGAPYYVSGAGVNYITPETPLTFNANDPVTSDVASGVERIETAVDGGAYVLYTAALKFPEGRHTIKYRAYDNVGNLEAAHTLEVQSDSTAPESRWLPASGPWIEKDNKFYLNALGSIALESADPVRNNVAAGLENIYYGIDAAPSVKYLAAFCLAEGVRSINYSAKDNLGNTELVKSTVVYVDGTKPATALSLSGDQYNDDNQYISQRTDIAITAADPVVNNVAVGVKDTKYSVDGTVFVNYSLFKLSAEGKRLVSYYSTDLVSNIETAKTTTLWVDNTPPSTELSIAGARYTAPGDEKLYVTRDSGIVLTSSDPVSNDTASGVMLTKYRIDSGNWLVYSGSFTIAVEGLHTLEYYALDRVQNAETLRTAKIAVDNTPPATGISLGEPKSEVFGLPVLMQNTPITLAAVDPVMNSVSAGLNSIFYELENAQTGVRSLVTAYTSPFTITEQGTFIIRYWSKDNTGNTEAPKEKMAAVTTWRADGLIAASGLDMSGTADISGSVKSNAIVSLGGNARILGDVTASTITLTGKAQITGLQINGATPVNPAPIYLAGIVQNAVAVNNNAIAAAYLIDGKLALSSKVNLILSTGTYYFKGMDLSGGSSITIAGKVDILVEGGITINGGSTMNAAGEASRLSIIVSTSSELKFNGGGALAACVYAPYSGLKLTGNALLGGHYFVKTATVSGTGNLLQSGEALPVAAAPTGGGPKTKAAAMPSANFGILAGPDPEFRLGEVYVFPNPAKGTEAPVFHIETGIADSVKITIYTISGRAAHEHTLTGLPIELDDGNGLSYAYEYTWRGHIPSGVYLYSIEARKAGQTLKKTGKFGIVR